MPNDKKEYKIAKVSFAPKRRESGGGGSKKIVNIDPVTGDDKTQNYKSN